MSADYNDINMSMVKQIINQIVRPFVHICNVSFQTGVFPDKMKIAKVVPLFISGEKNVFTNYRPISLLPQFSNILEKLYNERMDTFLNKHDILSPSQYGFRSNMSTSHALLELVEEITSSLDNKKYSVGIFIDLKKAFDTIDHDILANKLYFYGVGEERLRRAPPAKGVDPDSKVGGDAVNPERSFGGTNGEPPSEASQLRKGGPGVLPRKIKKNLHGKWCNLRYS